MSKPSFVTYVQERLGGFEPTVAPAGLPWAGSHEGLAFPEFYDATVRQGASASRRSTPLACTGPVRFHTCDSINIGPRVHDMQLADIVDVVLKVRAGADSFEAANPRHEHEWRVWERVTLPDDAVLIPGVITQSTVLVEHPELVAERLVRFASVVGRERVIAGADCGFASFAASNEIHPTVVWAKLAALVEGARLASTRLWSGR